MAIVLHDTARAARVELGFRHPGRAGIYSCGPTVHARKHLGDLRHYAVVDVLVRYLRSSGLDVRHVINITDVGHLTDDGDHGEDRVERAARRSGRDIEGTAQAYSSLFQRDLLLLGSEPPTLWAKASEHVQPLISLLRELEAAGLAYRAADGLYFDTSKDPAYGRFLRAQDPARALTLCAPVPEDKRRPSDFALWKYATPSSRREPWQSPWGRGFPGWHSECATMASLYLQDGIDLHTGTVEHIHAHHENERAQLENLTEPRRVGHWLHVAPLVARSGARRAELEGGRARVSGELRRMEPRFDNDVTLDDVLERGLSPRVARFFLLAAHYREKLEFSWNALASAAQAYRRLLARVAALPEARALPAQRGFAAQLRRRFDAAIEEDLDTPRALAALWTTLSHPELSAGEKRGLLSYMDSVLALDVLEAAALLNSAERGAFTPPVMRLVERRNIARAQRDYARADALRVELERVGFVVEDYADGTRVRPRRKGVDKAEQRAAG